MIPFAWGSILIASVLMRSDADVCVPGDNSVWVFCSHHKTGSVLIDSILKEIETETGIPHHQALDHELRTPENQLKSFAELSVESQTRLLAWKHVDLDNPDVLLASGQNGTTSKLVIFLRDPLEVILSGYFYHLKTIERWANEPYPDAKGFEKACLTGDRGNIASMSSCLAMQMLPPVKNHTYREVLNSVDTPIGVFIEAVRAISELEAMRRTYSAFMSAETCNRAIFCFLDDVVEDMESAFHDIFTFLGAEDVDHCVSLALKHDLRALEQQRASAAQVKHAMDSSMRPLRDALRLILKFTPWFIETIDPIRVDMQYPPVGPDPGTSPRRCQTLCP